MSKRVDILVPVYGAESYIERCAVSLLEQSYEAIVFYFLDDASVDNSWTILQTVVARYPAREVHLLRHAENTGLAASRGDLLDASKSEYLLQVDADDYLERDAIERLMDVAERTEADVVGMGCWFEWQNRKMVYRAPWNEDPILYTQQLLRVDNFANVCRHLIRRSLYDKTGIRPIPHLNMAEDYLVLPQLTRHADHIAYISDPLYHYWQANSQSYTHQTTTSNIDSLVTVCQILHEAFATDTTYAAAIRVGMWRKLADLMLHISRSQYVRAMAIPAKEPVPYAELRIDIRIAAWLISHRYWSLLAVYSTVHHVLYYLLQKLKGR